jgi:hypothetical protein
MPAAKRTQSLPVGNLLQEALWQGTGSVVCLKMGYTFKNMDLNGHFMGKMMMKEWI